MNLKSARSKTKSLDHAVSLLDSFHFNVNSCDNFLTIFGFGFILSPRPSRKCNKKEKRRIEIDISVN